MQFETFRGRNVEEALAAVRAALGATRSSNPPGTCRTAARLARAKPSSRSLPHAASEDARPTQSFLAPSTLGESDTPGAREPVHSLRELSILATAAEGALKGRRPEGGINRELRAIRSLSRDVARPPSEGARRRHPAGCGHRRHALDHPCQRRFSGDTQRPAPLQALARRLAERLEVMPSPIERPVHDSCVRPELPRRKDDPPSPSGPPAHLELGPIGVGRHARHVPGRGVEQMWRFVELIGVPSTSRATGTTFGSGSCSTQGRHHARRHGGGMHR